MIEVIIKDGNTTVIHGSICDKYKFATIEHVGHLIEDEENQRELREERPLEDSNSYV